jgi:hypothetical protein
MSDAHALAVVAAIPSRDTTPQRGTAGVSEPSSLLRRARDIAVSLLGAVGLVLLFPFVILLLLAPVTIAIAGVVTVWEWLMTLF